MNGIPRDGAVVDALGSVKVPPVHDEITFVRPKICCFFEKLSVDYFTLTALHFADKFSNEQQILGLTFVEICRLIPSETRENLLSTYP